MEEHLQEAKKALRAAMLARRNRLTPEEVQAVGETIAAFVLASAEFVKAHTVCSYVAIGNEAPTAPILRAALAANKRVVLPRTVLDDRRLVLHQVHDLAGLRTGRFGIPEPSPDAEVIPVDAVNLFIIPGSVFDRSGNRLGYGAGFYDTMLAHSAGCRMALAYAWQIIVSVPFSSCDVPMDLLVSEGGILDCRKSNVDIAS